MGDIEVETEVRTVDGSGWIRTVGESAESLGAWAIENTAMLGLILGSVIAAMIILRLLTRSGT